MAEQQDNSPQQQVAKGVIPFEADMQAVDAALDQIEQRIDAIGEKFARAFSGDSFRALDERLEKLEALLSGETLVEVGEPRTGESGVTATPIQSNQPLTEMARIAEDTEAIRASVNGIFNLIQQQGVE